MTSKNKPALFSSHFVIRNDRGLHTRPSTELIKCANRFKCVIFLTYQNKKVNAKSLLGVLCLCAGKGAKIMIEAEGDDAEEAVSSILKLAKSSFHITY